MYEGKKCVCVMSTKYNAALLKRTDIRMGDLKRTSKKQAHIEYCNHPKGAVDLRDEDLQRCNSCSKEIFY